MTLYACNWLLYSEMWRKYEELKSECKFYFRCGEREGVFDGTSQIPSCWNTARRFVKTCCENILRLLRVCSETAASLF